MKDKRDHNSRWFVINDKPRTLWKDDWRNEPYMAKAQFNGKTWDIYRVTEVIGDKPTLEQVELKSRQSWRKIEPTTLKNACFLAGWYNARDSRSKEYPPNFWTFLDCLEAFVLGSL